jgi:hypothetical protein
MRSAEGICRWLVVDCDGWLSSAGHNNVLGAWRCEATVVEGAADRHEHGQQHWRVQLHSTMRADGRERRAMFWRHDGGGGRDGEGLRLWQARAMVGQSRYNNDGPQCWAEHRLWGDATSARPKVKLKPATLNLQCLDSRFYHISPDYSSPAARHTCIRPRDADSHMVVSRAHATELVTTFDTHMGV